MQLLNSRRPPAHRDDRMKREFVKRRQASSENGIDGADSDPTIFLKSICILGGHRTSLYLSKEDMIFIRQIVWLRNNLFDLTDIGYACHENVEIIGIMLWK